MINTPIAVTIPQDTLSYEQFSQITWDNIAQLFDMSWADEQMSLDFFVHNTDHGLEHEYFVYTRALQIARDYEQHKWVVLRKHLLYPMAICHDAMRSVKYNDLDIHKIRKEKRNDRNHERYGALLFEKIYQKSQQLNPSNMLLTQDEQSDITDYLYNHDYFSQQLNGKRYHEPKSIEWQIVRLADRTSVSICDEIQRYRDTWKRLGTPLFNPDIPLIEREEFSFDKMSKYDEKWRIDEISFFVALLMITWDDFADPLLGERYEQWAIQKSQAVEYIKTIAKHEWADTQTYDKIHDLLEYLWPRFNFK